MNIKPNSVYNLKQLEQLLKKKHRLLWRNKKYRYVPPMERKLEAAELMSTKWQFYVTTDNGTGKVHRDLFSMWILLNNRLINKYPLYQFSTMWLLKKTFYFNGNDNAFKFCFGVELYSKLKVVFLHNYIKELQVANKSDEEIIFQILNIYGLGTLHFLQTFMVDRKNLINEGLIRIIKSRFVINATTLSKDEFFSDSCDISDVNMLPDKNGPLPARLHISQRIKLVHNIDWQLD